MLKVNDWVVAVKTCDNMIDVPVEPGESGVIDKVVTFECRVFYLVEFGLRQFAYLVEEGDITEMRNIDHTMEEE